MQENETTSDAPAPTAESSETEQGEEQSAAPASTEDITYHAVEKDGQVTAIWEMQGRKHLRTIDPRSRQGQDILRLYTTEHADDAPADETEAAASDAASS